MTDLSSSASGEDNLDRIFGGGPEHSEEDAASGSDASFAMFEEGGQEEDTVGPAALDMPEASQDRSDQYGSGVKQDGSGKKKRSFDARAKEVRIKKLSAPRDTGLTPMLLKLPGFVGIATEPYSAARVLEQELEAFEDPSGDAEAETSDLLLHAATSIRWRTDPHSKALQSNARLVKWSDGSWSLNVGKDQTFEVSMQSMVAENNYIYGRHVEEGSMECLGKLRERVNIRPFITTDHSHRKYLAAAASASTKPTSDVRVKMALTTADPEKEKQRMIKLEQEKIKARRKVEAQRRNLKQRSFDRISRTGITAKFLEERDEDNASGAAANEDEYEDDFIDDSQISDGRAKSSESEAEFSSATEGDEEEDEGETSRDDHDNDKDKVQDEAEFFVASKKATFRPADSSEQSKVKRARPAAIVDDEE